MRNSTLQLEHYELLNISVTPTTGFDKESLKNQRYPTFDESVVDFESQTKFRPMNPDEEDGRYFVYLALRGKPIDEAFPYTFEIALIGALDGSRFSQDKRRALTVVNGASMLFGVCREVLKNLTSQMHFGPLMLPSVQFDQLAQSIQADQDAEAQAKPALKSPAKKVARKTAK